YCCTGVAQALSTMAHATRLQQGILRQKRATPPRSKLNVESLGLIAFAIEKDDGRAAIGRRWEVHESGAAASRREIALGDQLGGELGRDGIAELRRQVLLPQGVRLMTVLRDHLHPRAAEGIGALGAVVDLQLERRDAGGRQVDTEDGACIATAF